MVNYYKLTYFDCKALGEPIRLLFVVAGVKFEDHRIPLKDFEAVKKYGFGQVPVLQENQRQLTQSLAIMQYLAKKFDLIPPDDFLAARCIEICDFVTELRLEFKKWITELDEIKKLEIKDHLLKSQFPKYYPILEELVQQTNGEFIAGNILSYADLFLANWLEIWEDMLLTPKFCNQFPSLKNLKQSVFSLPSIHEYLKTRQKSLF